MLRGGKSMVVSTYGIYRGFVLLEPSMVPEGQETFAGWLDGLEHFGRPVTLAEIAARGAFDFMVTGASAVSLIGVRFGKGHGFFDLEWGMFTDIGIAGEQPGQRAQGPRRQDPRGRARQRHLGRSDVPAQRDRAGHGQDRALRLRSDAAHQGRDRRLVGQANPARIWGIGLTATLIAALAYLAFALIANRVVGATRAVTIAAGAMPDSGSARSGEPPYRTAAITVLAVLLPFAVWWVILLALGISPIVAKTPAGLIDYLFFGNTAASAQARLLGALAETLPITLAGMAAGLMVAFGLAILGEIRPAIARSLMPVALVSQTMPLVALIPLLVLLLGRGAAVTLAITVSVTFFPAYVTMAQGLQLVPRAAFDLTRAYGASWFQELYMVAIPSALPYVFAATRLAVPRALLGVMIAEWLATGVGLGNLLNQSRGYLDYGLIWAVAVVSVILSILFYQAVTMVERRVLARAGMWGR